MFNVLEAINLLLGREVSMSNRIKDYHIIAISDFMRTSSEDLVPFCAPAVSVSVHRQSVLGFDIRYISIIKLSFSFVFSLYLLSFLHYLFISARIDPNFMSSVQVTNWMLQTYLTLLLCDSFLLFSFLSFLFFLYFFVFIYAHYQI